MPKQRDLAYLQDILVAARESLDFVKGLDEESFAQNRMAVAAVIRQIEVIGEATKRVSEELRNEYPEIP
ncbi:MAG TPA: HepT-like ribonuclease domain-containing protein, partial [Bdellovibrionota bacterium]|nr:HepT-like ribonuclease domain-containing protein [Bdellovibrionota bacterium]